MGFPADTGFKSHHRHWAAILAAPENKVNISADLAWGKAGATAFYLYVGEAF